MMKEREARERELRWGAVARLEVPRARGISVAPEEVGCCG